MDTAPLSKEILPPPTERYTILGWLHKNLFSSWVNGLFTILAFGLIYIIFSGTLRWAVTDARWEVVGANFRLFMVGQYPVDKLWRIWAYLYLLAGLAGLTWGLWFRKRLLTGAVLLGAILFIALAFPFSMSARIQILALDAAGLLGYGIGRFNNRALRRITLTSWLLYFPLVWFLTRGLSVESGPLSLVNSNFWGGLMLTFLLTVVGIVASFPFGVLLALGRQSRLPVLRSFSVIYIEFVRGVPLVTVLFMAQVMLPLFLPEGMTVERVARAMVGIILFSAAYMAENVRGGLQAIPKGQYEAAQALGLSGPLTMVLIVLPQALRLIIPILVGQFIALFKDTTLVAIVGLFDLLGIGRAVLAQPEFIGLQLEVYLFISIIYWIFSYAMSYVSQRLEVALGVGVR